jgi:alkylglycerol monooxygenase
VSDYVNYIQLAIPIFFICILIEMGLSIAARKDWYQLHDSLNDLACGSLDQILEIFYKVFFFAAYLWVYKNLRINALPSNQAWVWAACFLGTDIAYYWFHRCSHRVWLVWAGHGPHHQSEEYNLTVALRQGMFERCFSWAFYLPLAVLGFPPLVYLACSQFQTIYQFFVHTRAVKKLGPLEWVFNTPSHHRVHHGKNREYIDKNYAGVFILWDRLFGTFEPELAEPVYGTVKPLRSWNPIWAHAVFFSEIWAQMQGLPWHQALQVWFRPPGWHPLQPEPAVPEVDASTYSKYSTPLPRKLNLWLLFQFFVWLLLSTVFLELAPHWPLLPALGSALALMLGFTAVGALNEGKDWLVPMETARLMLSLGSLALLPLPIAVRLALASWAVLSCGLNAYLVYAE